MFYFSTSKYGIGKSILSQNGGCIIKNFPRPHHLPAPPIDLLVYNFLQWFNILHKILWNPGPMIFVIHSVFAIHIVSGPCNALHSINCYQRQFSQKLIKIKCYIYIFQEIRFLDKLPFGRRAKFGCFYAILEVVIAKFFWGSMPQTP